MKRYLIGIGMLAMLATMNVSADFISGDMTLRDAMYLYGQSVDAKGSKELVGYNCDVLQLVLDVTSGNTDLAMYQGNNNSELNASFLGYPDRIFDSADMFSYALYKNKAWKIFQFYDQNNIGSAAQIGTGTIFGYCYSTKPDAYVYFEEWDKCTAKYSDGYVAPLSNCTPSSGSGQNTAPSNMAELVGVYKQNIYYSAPGNRCSAVGAVNGTFYTTFNVTVSGNTLTLLGYNINGECHYNLNKLSGDSVAGYNMSGTAICDSVPSMGVSVSGVRKSGSKLLGTVTQSFSGCTQTVTFQ